MSTKNWFVYLLRCADNSLYCGISNDVENRVATHNAGRGAKYTKSRRPVELVATSDEMARGDALKLEYAIRKLRRCDQEQVIAPIRHFMRQLGPYTRRLKVTSHEDGGDGEVREQE